MARGEAAQSIQRSKFLIELLRNFVPIGPGSISTILIGVSRKEVNEVLGYRYRNGLDSRPVTRGAVSLEPASPRWSTPRLTIALKRIPDQDGRRMVIGRVAQGLEIADRIATRRLSPHKTVQYRPLVPARIFKARYECRRVEFESNEEEGSN